VLMGLIPGIALMIGAALLRWYPLQGAYLEKVKVELLVLHAKKHAQLEKSG
jgi:Na+/melibiose symporter-like transporter